MIIWRKKVGQNFLFSNNWLISVVTRWTCSIVEYCERNPNWKCRIAVILWDESSITSQRLLRGVVAKRLISWFNHFPELVVGGQNRISEEIKRLKHSSFFFLRSLVAPLLAELNSPLHVRPQVSFHRWRAVRRSWIVYRISVGQKSCAATSLAVAVVARVATWVSAVVRLVMVWSRSAAASLFYLLFIFSATDLLLYS